MGGLHGCLGLALGGEAGAPLAARLAIGTSPDTLLRVVRGSGSIPAPPTPRVLGVDDWAWCRGHRYGTALVDLERNQVADRWHLLRNLGDAVHALADRHGSAVRRAAQAVGDEGAAASTAKPARPAAPRPPNAAERASQAALSRRQVRYKEATHLHGQGVFIRRVAALLGADRKTVRGWLELPRSRGRLGALVIRSRLRPPGAALPRRR
jgi:hypothetical protein